MEGRLLCVCLGVLLLAVIHQAQCKAKPWKDQRDFGRAKKFNGFRSYEDDTDEYYYDYGSADDYEDDDSDEERREFYEYGLMNNWMQPKRVKYQPVARSRGMQLAPYRNNEIEVAEVQLEDLRRKMDKLTRKMEDIQNAIDPWNTFYDKK